MSDAAELRLRLMIDGLNRQVDELKHDNVLLKVQVSELCDALKMFRECSRNCQYRKDAK